MSLVSCVYCNAQISEHASSCPKCGNSDPTNVNKKNFDEKLIYLENQKKRYLPFTINCEECNSQIKIGDFTNLGDRTCPNCGFYGNSIKCSTCGRQASDFEPGSEKFYCGSHNIAMCAECGKIVTGEHRQDKYHYHGSCCGGSTVAYCTTCYNNKYRIENVPNKKGGILRWFGLAVIIYLILHFVIKI